MKEIDSSYLDDLNPPQREAVLHEGGPLLIIAGAGSGKTRVLTHRLAHLVRARGLSPREVLAITFTNKAANEMKERAGGLVGAPVRDMMIGTFHSACARVLRIEAHRLGYGGNFSILDEEDSVRTIIRCMADLGLDRKSYHPRAIKAAISAAKNEMVDAESFTAEFENPFGEVAGLVYKDYQERLRAANAMDFDDLLLVMVNIFELYERVLEKYRDRFKHVLVDEYQDTNLVQYRLVNLLAGGHRNLFVVGDDDQGIYSWRGADIRNILEFEKDYHDARVIKLEQNYRSTRTILSAAGVLVGNNVGRKDKTLWTDNPPGEHIRYHMAENEHDEAEFLCDELKCALPEDGVPFGEVAVFYRTHAQSRAIEESLVRRGIPYRIFGGTKFYERKEIKDVIAYMRLIANPRDEVSLRRVINVPRREIGEKTMGAVSEYARAAGLPLADALRAADEAAGLSPRAKARITGFVALIDGFRQFASDHEVDEVLREVWTRTGYVAELEAEGTLEAQGRVENIKELLNVAAEFRAEYGAVTLDDFLERASLVGDTDELDTEGGYVSLMTAHNAKGLEFTVVFMTGMEEGLFPHIRCLNSPEELEEERRLCYVGMTRARRRLYMTHASVRGMRGAPAAAVASRFLVEIPSKYIEAVEREAKEEMPERSVIEARVGDRVVHEKWGPGIVMALCEVGDDCEVTVDFPSVGRKRLLMSYAPLEKA